MTNTEAEALILENNFIKKYRPRYNVLLRDDKSYPYLLVSDHRHPRLAFHRGTRREKGKYYGPFPNGVAVRKVYDVAEQVKAEKRVQYFMFVQVIEVATGAIKFQNESNISKGLIR